MQLLSTEPQNVFKLCKNAFQLYKKSWIKCIMLAIGAMLFFGLLQTLFAVINYFLSIFHINNLPDYVFPGIQFIVTLFFFPFFNNFMLYTIFLVGMDNEVSWKNVFKLSTERFLQSFLAFIFTTITLMMVGLVIGIGLYLSNHITVTVFSKLNAGKIFTTVAGIAMIAYVFPVLVVYFPQIILEGKNSIESYSRNFQLASENRCRIAFFMILTLIFPYFIISSLITIPFYVFQLDLQGWFFSLVNFLLQLVIIPLYFCSITVLWNDLRLRKKI